MKTKQLFLFLMLTLTGMSWGQVTEGFDTTFPPTGWSNSGCIQSSNSPRTGTKCLGFNGINDAITTVLITNPNQLSFWYKRSSNTAAWGLSVEVLNNSDNVIATLSPITSSNTTYSEYTADLTSYPSCKIRLTDTRSTGTHERYVDDFSITIITNQAPTASSVAIGGTLASGSVLTGSYTYADTEGNPEGVSTFKWYRADDASGTGSLPISGATSTTYTLTPSDIGKYIRFGVVPVASAGTTTGVETFSSWSGAIGAGSTPVLNIAATNALTEANLTTETITLTLTNDTFADATLDASNFILNNAPAGVTVAAVVYDSPTVALLSLAYTNTDFDTNITNFNITINGAELTSASNLTAANNLTITALTETLTATVTLAFGTLCSNVTPSKASFVISGSNAKDGTIDLAALSGYTYSETENGTYTSTLSVAQATGTVNKTIWVTFSPTLAQTYNGNIVISGVGAPNVNKAVTGTGKIPVTGVVTTTAASAVASTSATLNGNLTTLGVCPATTEKGFVYCLTADSVNPVIEDAFADVESTTSSISTGNYSLNATLLTQGTSYTYRAFIYNGTDYVYGTAQSFITTATEPTNQPTSLVRSAVTTDGMTLNWTAATSNPVGYLVLRTTAVGATYPSTNPVDGTTYIVGTVLGNATVMFAGSGTEAIVSGLSPESQYSYEVYSYNGSGATINYRTSSPLQGQFYTLALEPVDPATAVTVSAITNAQALITATGGSPFRVAFIAKQGSPVDFIPVDGINYIPEANTIFGNGTNFNSGNYIIDLSSSTTSVSTTMTGLSPETSYHVAVYSNGGLNSQGSNNYLPTPVTTSFTTLSTTPTTAASAITFGTSTINAITVNSVTNGNGANRIMVVRPASASRVAPTNGITYTPNSLSFTDGANPTTGTNNIVVFTGTTISNQTITDLAINTNYTIDVYEYNGTGATTAYYYAASASASKATLNLSAPVAIAADPVSTNSFTAKWDAVVGATGYQLDVSAYESFAIAGASETLNEGFESGLPTGSYSTGTYTLSSGDWIGEDILRSTTVNTGSYGCQLKGDVLSSIETPSLNNITSISVYAKRGSNNTTLKIYKVISGIETELQTITLSSSTMTNYTIPVNITSGLGSVKIVNNGAYVAYIDDIVITNSNSVPSFISGYNSKEISGGATLSENITGLADETAYYYRVRAVNGSVVSANSNTITVTTETATTTWVSTNGGEWTNGAPTTVTDAIIDFPYNTTTAPIIAENLTVTTNGTLTVSTTNPVTIHGNLINTNATAGAINVLNGGTLLQPNNTTTNGNTGNITYNRNTANLQNNDFVYWSSPVSGAKATSMGSIDKIYDFNHSSQAWNHINLNPTANPLSSITLANGVGYAVRFIGASNNPNTAAFEGVPNNGDVTITGITSSGAEKYMLLGNPYPSALDLEGLQNDNASVLGQTFYFWTHANAYNGTNYNDADYATYNVELGAGTAGTNNGTAGTRYVSAGQGFFADLNSAGMSSATLTFKNSHRVIDNNTAFFRSAATQQNTSAAKIWFNFKNENAFKQTLLAYTPNAINGFDPVDATTFDGQPHVDFYTLAETKKLVIQARAPFVNTDVVPMGYRVSNAGTYTIEIDHLDNVWNTQNIYLKDNALNVVHDIKANPYSFTTPAGVFDTRFEIIYQTNALSNPDVSFDKAVIVFAKDKNIHINSGLETIKDVVVYDLQGRIITTKTNINATQAILTNVRAEEQVLLVKVTSTEGKITTKKVVF